MKFNPKAIREFLKDRFSLHEDSAHDAEIIESISRNVEFKGSNLWALIFAIFIASIGLNVNSTAVIIGAMLVSPLMGPIMGLGLGIGINDIELIRRALKNLLIAVVISVIVSAFYFLVTPLHEAQSELLARTTPTIWDVFIALSGGLAGIVGSTRKEKGNVIPGVAIATALMPPLCTAGYGIASGNLYYVMGAFYLFFINSVFICISTFVIVRYMKLPKKAFEDKNREKRVMRYILYVVIITALPSIYLAYNIVDKSIFEGNANRFIKNEFKFTNTHIINKSIKYDNGGKEISLLVIGDEIPQTTIDSLKAKLPKYNMPKAVLAITQGLNARQDIDLSQVKAGIIEDIIAKQEMLKKSQNEDSAFDSQKKMTDFKRELRALYPTISSYSLARASIITYDSTVKDTALIFMGNFTKTLSKSEQAQLKSWLHSRMKTDSVRIIMQYPHRTETY